MAENGSHGSHTNDGSHMNMPLEDNVKINFLEVIIVDTRYYGTTIYIYIEKDMWEMEIKIILKMT